MKHLASVLVAAGMLTACNPAGEGKAVSAPPAGEQQNDAVNADANANDATLGAGASSFTEAQARAKITDAGYTDVGELTQGEDGVWSGSAKKDGATANVGVDFKGAVSTR